MATMGITLDQPGWFEKFKAWVSVGSVLKAAIGLMLGATGAVYGVYQHFAKASELRALREEETTIIKALREQQESVIHGLSCDLAVQFLLSAKLAETHQQTREAMSDLAHVRVMDDLPRAIGTAVGRIDHALDLYKQERDRLLQKKVEIGGKQCGA